MAFTNFSETRPWAKAIREAVVGRTMPPWHAGPESRLKFHNDRSLTEKEIRTIAAWVDGGAVEGPKIEYPQPVRSESKWKLGKPDIVFVYPDFRFRRKATSHIRS